MLVLLAAQAYFSLSFHVTQVKLFLGLYSFFLAFLSQVRVSTFMWALNGCFTLHCEEGEEKTRASVNMPVCPVQVVGGAWLFNRLYCNVFVTLDVMMCTASILNLCAISIDR